MYLFLSGVYCMSQHICGSQSPACKNQLSPFATWELRMELGLPALAIGTFTHWAIHHAGLIYNFCYCPFFCQVLFCTIWWFRKNCKMFRALEGISQQRLVFILIRITYKNSTTYQATNIGLHGVTVQWLRRSLRKCSASLAWTRRGRQMQLLWRWWASLAVECLTLGISC